MITRERIRTFLNKQKVACNSTTLESLYQECRALSPEDTRRFIKEFHSKLLDKYGTEGMEDRWSLQLDQAENRKLEKAERVNSQLKEKQQLSTHQMIPNSKRYGVGRNHVQPEGSYFGRKAGRYSDE